MEFKIVGLKKKSKNNKKVKAGMMLTTSSMMVLKKKAAERNGSLQYVVLVGNRNTSLSGIQQY